MQSAKDGLVQVRHAYHIFFFSLISIGVIAALTTQTQRNDSMFGIFVPSYINEQNPTTLFFISLHIILTDFYFFIVCCAFPLL